MSNRRLVAAPAQSGLALALLLAVIPVLPGWGAAPAAADPSEWMPLRPGQRAVYEVHRDHSYIPEQGSIDRVFHTGTALQTTRAADGVARGGIAVEERVQLKPVAVGVPETTFEVRVYSFADGVSLHGSGAIAKEGDDPPVRYQPPLRLLPTARPGEAWAVGTLRDGDVSIEMRGEVVGIGKLDEKPGCESCLEVRYTGPVAGRFPIYGGEAEILTGHLERRVWYRRGVGIVRDVVKVESELKLVDEKRARTAQSTTLRLVEHTLLP